MIRFEFICLVSIGFITGIGIAWWAYQFEESTYATSDCVSEIWKENEQRTGTMPTVEEEKAWWADCAGNSK